MSSQLVIPLASVLQWARDVQIVEAAIVGLDVNGRPHMASTHGTLKSLVALRAHLDAFIQEAAERQATIAGLPERPHGST